MNTKKLTHYIALALTALGLSAIFYGYAFGWWFDRSCNMSNQEWCQALIEANKMRWSDLEEVVILAQKKQKIINKENDMYREILWLKKTASK